MAVLGSLTAILRADTRRFKDEMTGATRIVRQMKSTVGGAIGTISKFGALFGGVSVAGIAYFVKSQMDAIDATAKLSDRIGIATEDLVGFQHAADITGAGAATLNKGLEFLTKSLGEASTGIGESKQALELLGLSVDEIISLDPAQQFRVIAESTSRLAEQEQKAFVATKLFGRAGISLVNTLALGSAGLAEMGAEAEKLGLTFSRIEAAQVEAANDAMTRLKGTLTGVGRTLAIELAPMIEAAADSFTEWATEGDKLSGKIVEGLGVAVNVVAFLADGFSVLKGVIEGVGGTFTFWLGLIAKGLAFAVEAAESLVEVLTLGFVDSNLNDGIHDFADAMMRLGAEDVGQGFRDVFSGVTGEKSRAARAAIEDIRRSSREAAESLVGAGSSGKTAMQEIADGAEEASAAIKAAAKASADLQKAQDALSERYNEAIDSFTPGYKALREELGEHLGLYEELRSAGMFEEAKVLREQVAVEKDRTAEKERQAEIAEMIADATAAAGQAVEDGVQNTMRQREQHGAIATTMQRELDLLRASTDYERERLEIQYDLEDAIKRAGDDQNLVDLARQIAGEKLADLNQDIADAAERESKAHKESADEAERQARAMRDQADITKRFAAAPGTGGLFGFGKGRVGGFSQFYQPSVVRKRRRTAGVAPDSVAAPAPAAGAPEPAKLPDLSPKVEAILKAWEKVPPLWDRLDAGLGELQRASESGLDRMTRSAEKATSKLRDAVRVLDRKVNAFEDRLDRASDLSVAGG